MVVLCEARDQRVGSHQRVDAVPHQHRSSECPKLYKDWDSKVSLPVVRLQR